jgi:hypothetical protein
VLLYNQVKGNEIKTNREGENNNVECNGNLKENE